MIEIMMYHASRTKEIWIGGTPFHRAYSRPTALSPCQYRCYIVTIEFTLKTPPTTLRIERIDGWTLVLILTCDKRFMWKRV